MSERRVAIADAAISLLADGGMHALTHRAVDQHLGMSAGSTSYYFRSRESLVQATLDRLVALDDAELVEILAAEHGAGADADSHGAGPEPGRLPHGVVAQLFAAWSAPERRERLMARFELLLAGVRDDRGNPVLDAHHHFVERTREAVVRAGLPNPDDLAVVVVALFNGFLLDVLVSRGADRESRIDLLRRVEQMLRFGAPDAPARDGDASSASS